MRADSHFFFIPLLPENNNCMELHYTGVIIAVSTFLIIGLFHPLVIKTEYHSGTRYWWVFLILGILTIGTAFLIKNVMFSAIMGVVGASLLWSIGELFAQKKRVKKGWFPMNPKRKHEYEDVSEDESLCPVCKDNPPHPASYKEK